MNYNTVEITLDGNKMPVCFNMLAIGRLAKRAGISVGEVFKRFGSFSKFEDMNNMMGEDLDFVYTLIHVGLEIGATVSEKDFKLNTDQVACLVGFDADIMLTVFNCFADSMPQDTAEEEQAEDTKKKLQKAS